MLTPVRNQRGSALMVAVIAMLIMGVLSLSFSILANIESRIGISYKEQAQAEAAAEAGLEYGRDAVRNTGALGTGFLSVFGNLWSGASKSLNGGEFWARIDNDCAGLNTVSELIQESTGCDNSADNNKRAVITAWAKIGSGRARVRAMLGEDDAWKHVCADSKNDANGGICTKNTKGNPTVSPSDPSHENGPKGFDDLPRPIIGCSRIDPTLHGQSTYCTSPNLFAYPAVATGSYGTVSPGYPAYPNLSGSNHVIMGEDPAITTLAPFNTKVKTCNNDTVNLGVPPTNRQYFGYFDCALTTPCDPAAGHNCPGLNPSDPPRKACVHPADSRSPQSRAAALLPALPLYDAPTLIGGEVDPLQNCEVKGALGMVYLGTPANFKGNIGSTSRAMVIYVAQRNTGAPVPSVQFGPQDLQFYGAIVVEGNLESKNKADMCTGWPTATPPGTACQSAGSYDTSHYAYPLAILAYDPKLPIPTVTPQAPQPILTDFGSNNTDVVGSVYSGGSLSFNPINVNGSSVAFAIDLQASTSTYVYEQTFGNASPPSGFMSSLGPVGIVRKSFIVCSTYTESTTSEADGPTQCK